VSKDAKAEKLRMMAEFRRILEERIEETKTNLNNLEILLELVNETLLEKGFKRAATLETKPIRVEEAAPEPSGEPPQPLEPAETITPLRTSAGVALAELHSSRSSLRVVIAEEIALDVHTPPFQQFLIERVLNKMREKDDELTRNGELAAKNALSYEIVRNGDVIREIRVENLTQDRLRELKSSIHWTLEKMYEKM
jgi:hypothetical protein